MEVLTPVGTFLGTLVLKHVISPLLYRSIDSQRRTRGYVGAFPVGRVHRPETGVSTVDEGLGRTGLIAPTYSL